MPTDVPSGRPLLDKLGVRPGHRVSLVGLRDAAFMRALQDRGADVSTRLRSGSDMIFLAAASARDLERIAGLRKGMKLDGAIWVIREKGKNATLKDTDIIDAALRARLVDNKIASFSDTQAAMRLVIRLVDR